jgi:hypothetical protein
MNKRLIAFTMFVMFVLTNAALSQQPDAVIAKGQPDLTEGMVSELNAFFEWALDISLSPAQKTALRNNVISAWTKNDKAGIDGTMTIIKAVEQLSNATADARESARQQVQPELLKSLRAEPDDAVSKMLVAAYESAHPAGPGESGPPVSSASSGLVGKWHSGSASGTNYYNPSTGSWAAPSGTGQSYELMSDGRYVYAGLLQTSMYSCTTSVFFYETGKWNSTGSTLNFIPTSGRTKSQDNCNRSFNYDRPKTPASHSVGFSFKVSSYSPEGQLCMTDKYGETCYNREN